MAHGQPPNGSQSPTTLAVSDPATGDVIGHVPNGGVDEAAEAIERAAAAFDHWRWRSPRERSDVLRRAYELIHARADDLARTIVAENGKTRADADSEVLYAAEFFRWYSEEAVRIAGTYGPAPAGGARTIVTHRPAGVAALVTPWNFPAAMIARKVAPALAAGCTAVIKPAEETPLTAIAMADLLAEAGVPDGVVEIVTTSRAAEVVDCWLEDRRVRKLSFTGSTRVGKMLLRRAADRVVTSSLELGGNAPFVVAADADLESCVQGALAAKLRGGGQACTAANTFFVDQRRVDEFVERFGAAVEQLVVGAGGSPATDVGPVISAQAADRIVGAVVDAVDQGATITHQAAVPSGSGGYFVAPMVVRDVPADSTLVRDELFGPVAPVVSFDHVDEVIDTVNSLEHGLAAYVYSADLRWALKLTERLDCGMVGVNRGVISDPAAPFGGMKESGLGREGARDGLEAFLETQYVSVDW